MSERPETSPSSSDGNDAPWQSGGPGEHDADAGRRATEPNPFSREGSVSSAASASDVPVATPEPTPEQAPGTAAPQSWPGYPPSSTDTSHQPVEALPAPPYGTPQQSYGPSDPSPYGAPNQPYGASEQTQGAPEQRYGGPTQAYPPAGPYDPQPQAGYGVNPYAPPPNPYQPSYGAYSPYGVAPAPHPKATPALIFGILGLVLGLSCGIGGLLGIGGVVAGGRARREIDADPQRYTGRSMASAGYGLGIAGIVVMVLYISFFVILGVTGNLA